MKATAVRLMMSNVFAFKFFNKHLRTNISLQKYEAFRATNITFPLHCLLVPFSALFPVKEHAFSLHWNLPRACVVLLFSILMKTLAKRTKGVSESQTFAIAGEIRKLKAAGEDIVSFALGEPDFPSPKCARDAAVDALDHNFTKYTAFEGIPELRQAVAEKFRRDNKLSATAETVLVSCGGKQAIYNALQAICEEGDEVLIPSPYWVSYPEMVKLASAKPVFIKTG